VNMTTTSSEHIQKMMNGSAETVSSPTVAKALRMTAPLVGVGVHVATVLWPYVWQMVQACRNVYSVMPVDLISALVGLVWCFCGGLYPTVFAAVEAARLTGWAATSRAVTDLADEAAIIAAESKKDDAEDKDGDGVADVKQMDGKQLLLRKTKLVLTHSDPEKINNALSGLYMSWISVIAALKVKFARTITLAMSVADVIKKPCSMYLTPALLVVVPAEFQRWIPVAVGWFCTSVGITVAWYIQRVMSAVVSSVRGGLQCSRALMRFAAQHGISGGGAVKADHTETALDEVLGWTLAALGFYFQYSLGFQVPFPFNVLLWPFAFLERRLMWASVQ